MSPVVRMAEDGEHDDNAVWQLSDEVLNAQHRYTELLSDDPSDEVLVNIAHDLGDFVLDLANDPRLEQAMGSASPSAEIRQTLYQLLLVDWTSVLESQGVGDHALAQHIRDALLESLKAPQSDTYGRLRGYLTDLGNRLADQEDVAELGRRQRRRITRRVGRALWVIGRIGIAVGAGAAVAAVLPAVPFLGLAATGVAAVVGHEVVKEVVKGLVEQVIPKPGEGALDAREDVEFNSRLANFSSLVSDGRIGLLRGRWNPRVSDDLPADARHRTVQETRAWISAVQASLLVIGPLGRVSWGGGGDYTIGHVVWVLSKLDEAVAGPRRHADGVAELIDELDVVISDARRLIEEQRFRPHH